MIFFHENELEAHKNKTFKIYTALIRMEWIKNFYVEVNLLYEKLIIFMPVFVLLSCPYLSILWLNRQHDFCPPASDWHKYYSPKKLILFPISKKRLQENDSENWDRRNLPKLTLVPEGTSVTKRLKKKKIMGLSLHLLSCIPFHTQPLQKKSNILHNTKIR